MPSRKDKVEGEVGQGGHPGAITFLEMEKEKSM